jgi:hypothetical protein
VRVFKRWSFFIGVVALLCAPQSVGRTAAVPSPAHGMPRYSAFRRLLAVPLIYFIVRSAERQIQRDDERLRGGIERDARGRPRARAPRSVE